MSNIIRPSNPFNTVSARKPDGDIEDDCLYASVSSFEFPDEEHPKSKVGKNYIKNQRKTE